MHELSVAQSLVEFIREQMEESRAERAMRVHIHLGAMCGLEPMALKSAYRAAIAGTALRGSELEVELLPVIVWCPHCRAEQPLADIRLLRCPVCQTRTPQMVQGKEMEIVSIEVDDAAENSSGSTAHSQEKR